VKIWVVTTGSSDVQLATDDFWNDWYRSPGVKSACYDLPVEKVKPKQVIPDSDELYRVAPRLLGQVYDAQPEQVWECLRFPLLDSFTARIRDEGVDQIVLLLTDQGTVFEDDVRDDVRCPYWQDTGALLPVFKRYFSEHFTGVELTVLPLQPQMLEQGLDDWNEVLTLVRTALGEIQVEPDVVYVSHQAGTPAISSAVQFVSLARFRGDVQFLLSNEYRTEKTQLIVGRSTYLRGIQIQEAKALLDHYDYAGVRDVLGLTKTKPANPQEDKIKSLLDAAVQWNLARFETFADMLGGWAEEHTQNFYWIGYEAAYLGVIRMKQKATVDALFHTFRSVEGLIAEWAEDKYEAHIYEHEKYGLQIRSSILSILNNYFSDNDYLLNKLKSDRRLGLYSDSLFYLLKADHVNWNENSDIPVFFGKAKKLRNETFHKLGGLTSKQVFEAWETDNFEAWVARVLGCLNFVSEQNFNSIKEASLMAKVHQRLKREIASLAQPPG
jgi:hypothetical protein